MTNPFDQLNLRPQERRILVIVGLIVFVVLNFLLVTPLFGQLAQSELALDKSKRTLKKYETEIAKTPNLERIEARLKQEGGTVLSEELQLQRIVNNQAITAGVQVSRSDPILRPQIGRTNQFFEDQGLRIDFTSGGKELVDFLVGMASGNSMVHVHDMALRPVSGGTRLGGNIIFVASYQKKNAPTTRALESGAAPRPATKTTAPVASTGTKSNPPAISPPKANAPKTITTPPPSRNTNAAVKPVNASKTISTNSAKPPKK
jgi:Tfp pilus assembly protein PilO